MDGLPYPSVFQIGLNAMANSSRMPVDADMLVRILSTGDGPGNLVRALFEDCDLESLDRMAAVAGLSPRQLRAAYAIARENTPPAITIWNSPTRFEGNTIMRDGAPTDPILARYKAELEALYGDQIGRAHV